MTVSEASYLFVCFVCVLFQGEFCFAYRATLTFLSENESTIENVHHCVCLSNKPLSDAAGHDDTSRNSSVFTPKRLHEQAVRVLRMIMKEYTAETQNGTPSFTRLTRNTYATSRLAAHDSQRQLCWISAWVL